MIGRLETDGTPTKATNVLRYSRLVFRWALNRGLVPHNPVQESRRPRSANGVNHLEHDMKKKPGT